MRFINKKFKLNNNGNDASVLNSNYLRTKYITALVSLLEIFMLIIFAFKYELYPLKYRFTYFFMYLFLLVLSASIFMVLQFNKSLEKNSKTIKIIAIVYAEIYLIWGAAITIIDQFMYAQIVVFVTNILFCSTAFIFKPKTFLEIILLPLCTLFIALPYTPISNTMLLGNYVNLIILIIAAVANNYLQFSLFDKQDKQKNEIKKISEYDELTKLHNRRSLNKYIEEFAKNNKNQSLGVLMIDIDFFKQFNDTYGHIAGDFAISEVGEITNKYAALYNGFAVRYGGEEFLIIFQNITHKTTTYIAESICKETREKDKNNSRVCTQSLSVSIGVYFTERSQNDLWLSIKNADDALFHAKKSGRNNVSESAE